MRQQNIFFLRLFFFLIFLMERKLVDLIVDDFFSIKPKSLQKSLRRKQRDYSPEGKKKLDDVSIVMQISS